MNKFKMDNIGTTNIHYKKIYNISLVIMLFILQTYLVFILSGVDIFNFNHVENRIHRCIMQIITQTLIFSVGYIMVYLVVKKVYVLNWIHKNKNTYLQGMWLHIHVKKKKNKEEEIRIGYVNILQNFNTIKAFGNNMYPECEQYKSQRETNWEYVLGKVFDDNYKRDFIGVYEAKDVFNNIPRNGIHSLNIVDSNEGYPSEMVGKFGDTVELGNYSDNVESKAGKMYLFKPSKECSKYLFSGDRNKRIFDLHNIDDFAGEPYVLKLKKILAEIGNKVC